MSTRHSSFLILLPLLLTTQVGAADIPFTHVIIDPSNVASDVKAMGDIDGDGKPDLVVGDNSGTPLQWYRWPDWTKHVIDNRSVFTTDTQVGSVHGDAHLDVIVVDHNNAEILWYGNPNRTGGDVTGAWTKNVIGSSRAHDIEVGDVDADGDLDVVVRPAFGKHTLFRQNNPTSWTKVEITTSTGGEGTALGDIDGDGDLDILGNGYWLEAPADQVNGTWTNRTIDSDWPSLISGKIVDMNDDGRRDAVLAHSESTGRMVWYEAPADPKAADAAWTEHVIESSVDYVHYFEVRDFDNDGDLDIAFAEMQQSSRKRVGIFRNNGDATSWTIQVLSTNGSHNIRAGDIDADGDFDFFGSNYGGTSPVELWRNDTNTSTNGSPTVVTAASASPNPVTGTTATLSALGADDGGEEALTYTWATTGTPPATVSFSPNGTNAAQESTATFAKMGTYQVQVTITDADGLSTTSSVTVDVDQSPTSISIDSP